MRRYGDGPRGALQGSSHERRGKPDEGNLHVRFDEGPLARALRTAGWGLLHLYVACLPSGQPTTLQFMMPGYVTTYLAEFSLTASPPTVDEVVFMMFCSSSFTNFATQIPNLNTSLATVFGLVNPGLGSGVAGCDGGFAAGQLDGWTFSVSLVDGGAGSGGPWPVGYLDPSGDLQAIDATFDTGQAVAYNVDPGAQYVAIHGVNPALGVQLPSANSAFGLTGRVYVSAGAFSYDPWIVPGLNAFQCPGGTNTAGCPATGLCTLASGQSTPLSIAVDGTSVYWTDQGNGTVMKVPLGGGSGTKIGSSNLPYGIAVDGTSVYWADFQGTIMKVPLSGGNATPLASGQSGPYGIALDSQNVYWTNYLGGTIMKVPITGGNPTTLASGQVAPNSLAVDSQNVYWSNNGTEASNFTDGTVMKAPITGGNATALLTGVQGPLGIAVDASGVYVADFGTISTVGGSIYKVPHGGVGEITLASGLAGPSALAIDAASVYWTNFKDPGTIMSVPLSGGSVTTLATGQNTPAAIAVGPTGVYWTNWGDGTVMRVTPGPTSTGTTSGGTITSGGTTSGGGTTTGGSSSGGGSSSTGGCAFSPTTSKVPIEVDGGTCNASLTPSAGMPLADSFGGETGNSGNELASCSSSSDCDCPLACVKDMTLLQLGITPNVFCERPCGTSSDCDRYDTVCLGGFCTPNACTGANIKIGGPCDALGCGDGTCTFVDFGNSGYTGQICFVAGSSTSSCTYYQVTTTPSSNLCAQGFVCQLSGVTASCVADCTYPGPACGDAGQVCFPYPQKSAQGAGICGACLTPTTSCDPLIDGPEECCSGVCQNNGTCK
jgi:sugar lactone lactonase YvrE